MRKESWNEEQRTLFFWGVTVRILHIMYRILMVFFMFVLIGDIYWWILSIPFGIFVTKK